MTFAEAVAALMDIEVTGVRRAFDYQPKQLNSGDMPALFPTLPTSTQTVTVLNGAGGLPSYQVTLMLVIEPVMQNQAPVTWEKAVSLLDALQSALMADTLDIGLDTYRVRLENIGFSETLAAWTWVCEVEIS